MAETAAARRKREKAEAEAAEVRDTDDDGNHTEQQPGETLTETVTVYHEDTEGELADEIVLEDDEVLVKGQREDHSFQMAYVPGTPFEENSLITEYDGAGCTTMVFAGQGVHFDDEGLVVAVDVAAGPQEGDPEPDEAQPPPGIVLDDDGPDAAPPWEQLIDGDSADPTPEELAALEAALNVKAEESVLAPQAPFTPFVGAMVHYVVDRNMAEDCRLAGDRGVAGGDVYPAIITEVEDGRVAVRVFVSGETVPFRRNVEVMAGDPDGVTLDHGGKCFRPRGAR